MSHACGTGTCAKNFGTPSQMLIIPHSFAPFRAVLKVPLSYGGSSRKTRQNTVPWIISDPATSLLIRGKELILSGIFVLISVNLVLLCDLCVWRCIPFLPFVNYERSGCGQ